MTIKKLKSIDIINVLSDLVSEKLETTVKLSVSIICVHNHPSGDAHPSSEDINMTQKLIELGKMMNVDIVDHIIIGRNQYYSFKAERVYSSI